MALEKQRAALKHIETHLEDIQSPVLVIPEGFPDADVIRKNVAAFLEKRGATRTAHLIMLIHDQDHKIEIQDKANKIE